MSAKQGFVLSTLEKMLSWANKNSLWFTTTGSGCCADEVVEAIGARYDLERFGLAEQVDATQADLLIVSGSVNYKLLPHLVELYQNMSEPKYVLAVGSCACCGGLFSPEYSYSVVPGIDRVLPVDAYVPGCPPRPEAIMNGILELREKISGKASSRAHQ